MSHTETKAHTFSRAFIIALYSIKDISVSNPAEFLGNDVIRRHYCNSSHNPSLNPCSGNLMDKITLLDKKNKIKQTAGNLPANDVLSS